MNRGWQLRYAPHLGVRSPDTPLFLNSAGSADPLTQIRYAAEIGFSGIQDNQAKMRPVDMQRRMGEELARLNLSMGCIVSAVAPEGPLPWGSRDRAVRESLRREVRASIETAGRLGGRCIVIVSGIEPLVSAAIQREIMAENLGELAPEVARAGMMLCLEPVAESRVAGLLLRHIADAHALVRAVDSSAVRLVFDTFHVHAMDGNVIKNFYDVRDVVEVVQLADSPDRLEPGCGEIPLRDFLRGLRDAGYSGLVELEHNLSEPGLAGEQLALKRLREIDATI